MNLGVVVEVAIGIIFVWIVFSLTVSQIQEWISTVLDRRAKDMEFAIREMLANPDLKAQFYDHPVIRGLTLSKRRKASKIPTWFYRYPILRGFTKEKRKIPSYIPSQQFALALFDIAMTANTESSLIQQGILRLRDDLKNNNKLTVHHAVIEELNLLAELARSAAATEAGTAITHRTVEMLRTETQHFVETFRKNHPDTELDDKLAAVISTTMDQTLKEAVRLKAQMDDIVSKQPQPTSDLVLAKVRNGVAALSVISPEVNQSLNALLMNVEEYAGEKEKLLAKARGNVETWFDDSMDRVSGVYKRYAQNLALAIGLVLALIMNVDSITITTYLWRQPSVRDALAAQANTFELSQQELQTNPEQAMADFTKQFAGINLPVGWTIRQGTQPAYLEANCQLFPSRGSTQSFGIPVFGSPTCIAPAQPNNETNLLLLLLGALITAVAARLGAPFWFDMLKRLVNLRSTGPNPAEKAAK